MHIYSMLSLIMLTIYSTIYVGSNETNSRKPRHSYNRIKIGESGELLQLHIYYGRNCKIVPNFSFNNYVLMTILSAYIIFINIAFLHSHQSWPPFSSCGKITNLFHSLTAIRKHVPHIHNMHTQSETLKLC